MLSRPRLLRGTSWGILLGTLQRIRQSALRCKPQNRPFLVVRLGRGPIQPRLLLLQQKPVACQGPLRQLQPLSR